MEKKTMKYNIGTAYDTNPARIQILIKRNRKAANKKRIYLASLFSTIMMGFAWAAKQILH